MVQLLAILWAQSMREQHQNEGLPLFREDCFFTDDTVMTCAVAEAIMEGGTRDAFIDAMKNTAGCTPTQATAAGSGRGCGRTAGSPTTALETGLPCGSLPCAWVMDCGFCARTGVYGPQWAEPAPLSVSSGDPRPPRGVKGRGGCGGRDFHVPLPFRRLARGI